MYFGIYKLEGNLLKICAGNRRSERPSEFFAEFGSQKELLVLRRVGNAVVSNEAKEIQGNWQVESLSTPSDAQVTAQIKGYLSMTTGRWFSRGNQISISANQIIAPNAVYAHYPWYTLDPSSRPKRFALGSLGSEYFSGIYELSGERLTISLSVPNVRIPSRNVSKFEGLSPPSQLIAGPRTVLVVLKRMGKSTENLPEREIAPGSSAEPPAAKAAAAAKALQRR
jgi:uncharacterized protein (TIGR03067 family)